MSQTISIKFIFRWIVLGLLAGGIVLFFVPGSQLPVNWQTVQKAWQDFEQMRKQSNGDQTPRSQLPSFAGAVKLASPAVVSINTYRPKSIRPLGEDKILDVSVGIGSGVIFSAQGYIVTNFHVIEGAENISVNFTDGRKRYARLVGSDRSTDLAVLQVEIDGLKPAVLGHSDQLQVGDLVVAIGNPLSLGQTVTMGIVSDIDHGVLFPHIKTDATINYGNSGGALINARGEVVGINSRKLNSKVAGEVGINIAIPVDIVRTIVDEIVANGKVIRNWLGIDAGELDPISYQRLFPNLKERLGIIVRQTELDSPAEAAGILRGDLITHADGKPIRGIKEFYQYFKQLPIGASLTLNILRQQRNIEIKVKLREKPARG